MAKNLFVDTDNNRLLAGPLTTQIATRPIFYGATAETVTVDLIERDSLQNLLNLAQPSGTTVALRVGVPGNVISVPSLSAISQAGITATATCSLFSTTTALGTASLYSGVTATATASLFGNITALATAVVTRGTACTLSLTVASVRLPIIAFGAVSAGQKIYSSISYSYGGVDALEQSLNPHYQNTNPLPTFSTIDFAYSLYLSDSFDHNTGGPIVVTSPAPSLVVTGSSFDPYDPPGKFTGLVNTQVASVVLGTVPTRTDSFLLGRPFKADFGRKLQSTDQSGVGAAAQVLTAEQGPVEFVDIVNVGQGLYGSPQVYFIGTKGTLRDGDTWNPGNGEDKYSSKTVVNTNITDKCTFRNGKLMAIDPSFFSIAASERWISHIQIGIVPDPEVFFCAESVTVASAGSGFPNGINIPFTIPSDRDQGIGCQGIMRAVNGSVISVISITSRGTHFSSSTTTGKNFGILPAYQLDSISVTCAGAGYFGAAPSVTIDDTFLDTSLAGSAPAQAVAVTKADGSVLLQITNRGYGYTTTPGIVVAAPRLADAVRTASLTNTPTGYALGTYACDVEAPGAGTSAVINLIVTAGGSAFVVANSGFGYTTPPVITAPAPNLTGSVQAVSVSCQGAGYTTAPTVTFTGDGTGAAGTAVLSGGRVVGVTITTYGSGYTSAPTVTFAAPTNQGRIQSISVVSGGTNYTTAPAVFFAGSGEAAATAVIANGTVTSISLSEAGSGYAAAPVVTLGASPSRTVYSGVLTVTTAFVNAILPSTTVTVQVQATTTVGTSTLLQVPGTVAASL